MDFKNASLAECLEQLELLDMKDSQGHPLKGSAAFQRLIVLADPDPVFEVRTHRTQAEYQNYCMQGCKEKPSLLIGCFTGDPKHIKAYLADAVVGEIYLEKMIFGRVTPAMAKSVTDRLTRIAELEAELATLKSTKK